ncbi:hypothetical protein A3H74_04240 [Candidatus Kaiserbacteria bacterium RIFCSPLOWO2_02_FULL_51_13]|uniref:Uncharacterized protein n=1 Tax=Candidatus Kaiserbacteria bacterium RIFCSPLOWO2_01_FULL_50_24 TaxID=1798507 RepID=A0A1F6EN05_9BACT|nr:MAG: hypothetical protein A3A34_02640 [Candidatus Kaiserbacteria bacterium RIFCSPLOWO2_01_FULL_50_24]OGG82053.1 MAG: hypothetical protein A3H74_04240 [Candidatus Kaiserbacteria bacterium RIFCSPLOWO2_02_FULL_51_13]
MTIQGSTAKTLLSFALVAFLLLGTFGFSHAGMTTGMDGQMADCPFTPGVAICNMSPLEMISASQSLFTTLPQQQDALLLLMLLVAGALALAVFWKPFIPLRPAVTYSSRRKREYIPVFNALQELFSNGILNPKLY